MKNRHRPGCLGAGAAVAGLLLGGLTAPPAYAEPPANDSIAAATPISSLPSSFEQDITEATGDRSDGRCVGGRSIWYRYRPAVTQLDVRVTTVGSDYDTLLAVFRGSRDNRARIACDDDRVFDASGVRVDFIQGKRYWIAVSTDHDRTTHGLAVLNVYEATAPGLSVTVDDVAAGLVSGRFYISGTATCPGLPSYLSLRVVVSQKVGEDVARAGEGMWLDPLCSDTASQWEFTLDSDTFKAFQPGQAVVSLKAEAIPGFDQETWTLPPTVLDVTEDPR